MPLPQTNYIDAGPGVPLANPSSTMAQGKAYAEMGNTIAAIGERGMQIAGQLRAVKESGEIASLWEEMEKDASDFQISLMTRDDMDKWPAEWKQRSERWKGEAKKRGLSPVALQKFDERFLDWNARRSISFETQAATKTIEVAKGRIQNALAYHMDSMNEEGFMQTLDSAGGIFAPHEVERAKLEFQKNREHNDMLADIEDDPVGWMETHKEPPPGYNMTKWNQVQAHARGQARQQTYDVAGSVQDGIVSGKITTPEQVREAAGHLRPTEQVELENFLAKWNEAEAANLRNDPEFQAGIVGEFERQLADYKPAAGDDEDMPWVRLRGMAEMVKDPALREDMDRRLKFVQDNQKVEAQSHLDLMLDQVTAYAKTGKFGKVPDSTTHNVNELVRGRLLRNKEKLKAVGFKDDQIEKIMDADDDNARKALVQDFWTSKGKAKSDVDQFTFQAFEAIWKGRNDFEFGQDEAAAKQAEIDIKTGKIRTHMKNWTRLNPEAARDPVKIQAELQKSTGLEIRRPATRITPKPTIPTETSMNALPKPLAPLAPVFQEAATRHGIDPRLLMAISMHETGNGTSSAYRNKRNAMGVSDAKGPIAFDDAAASVERMARVLASPNGPYKNARTLAEIGAVYAPPGAGNDPRGLNSHWVAGVSKYLRKLGGDPNRIFTT